MFCKIIRDIINNSITIHTTLNSMPAFLIAFTLRDNLIHFTISRSHLPNTHCSVAAALILHPHYPPDTIFYTKSWLPQFPQNFIPFVGVPQFGQNFGDTDGRGDTPPGDGAWLWYAVPAGDAD